MVKALTLLFTIMLDSEDVPANWRQGFTVRIFKSGDRCDPGNYRGITVLSAVGIIFANVIRVQLTNAVPLHETRAAFCSGRSCIDHVFTLNQLVQARKRASLDTFFSRYT